MGKDEEGKLDFPEEQVDLSETDKLLTGMGYTAEELEDLSDEEKSAMLMKDEGEEEGSGTDDEDALKKIAGEDESPEEKAAREATEAAAVQAEKDKGKSAEEIAAEKTAAEQTAAAAGEVLTDEQLLNFRPLVKEEELPNVDKVPDDLASKLADLDAKYDAGEIELKDYNSQRDTLNRQIYRAQDRAVGEAKRDLEWQKTQLFFFHNRKEYFLEGITDQAEILRRSAMFGALEKTVDRISTDPRYAHYSDMQLLIEADKIVKGAFGAKSATADDKAAAATVVQGKPPAQMPKDHVTLGEIPASGADDVSGDPFAALDRLTGEEYEAALERLTPAQRDAYENGASRSSKYRAG